MSITFRLVKHLDLNLLRDWDKQQQLIGVTTSGAYGHAVRKSLAFAYVHPQYADTGTNFEIRILSQKCSATVLKEAAYDPQNSRLKDV